MRRSRFVLVLAVVIGGCDGTSPTAPTPQAPPTLYTITGTVNSGGGGGIAGAAVTVSDGPNAGKSTTTDVVGRYMLGGLTFANFTVTVSANGFNGVSRGGILMAGITTATADFALLPSAVFSRSGSGDNDVDVPSHVSRVRVDANYPGSCQRFMLQNVPPIGPTQFLVNVIIGTCSAADTRSPFTGTYPITGGGNIEIVSSTDVAWIVAEVR
jgi:hypothetical protein